MKGDFDMQIVAKIQDALCANHEILTFLPELFARFEVEAETAEQIFRALKLFRSALEAAAALPEDVNEGVVVEMLASNGEIAAHVATALENARVPRELSCQIAAVFDEFATGLRTLATTSEATEAAE